MHDYLPQPSLDDSHDPNIDPNLLSPAMALAGISEGNDSFGIDLSKLGPVIQPDTQNIPLYPQGTSFLSSTFGDQEIPWNHMADLRNQDTMNAPQDIDYSDTRRNKRRRTDPDSSGIATQTPSTASAFSFGMGLSTSTTAQRHPPFSQSPPLTHAPREDLESSASPDMKPHRGTPSTTQPKTRAPAQTSAPRPVSRAQKGRQSKKFWCMHCPEANCKSFNTTNDLERHRKGVHGIFNLGDKLWRCKINGCTCANKIWPRRDNFTSHLKRMHYPNDPAKAQEVVDNYQETYNVETHGFLEIAVNADNSHGAHRRRRTHEISPATARQEASADGSTPVSHQPHISSMGALQRDHIGSISAYYPPARSTASMLNSRNQTTASLSGVAGAVPQPNAQHLLTPHPYGGAGAGMPRLRTARTAPNPGGGSRRKREMRESDDMLQQTSPTQPSSQDFASIGDALAGHHTVDPAMLSHSALLHATMALDTNNTESEHASSTGRTLDELLRDLKQLHPNHRAQLLKQLEQSEVPGHSQGFHPRSVSKSSTKKKADGEKKELKCLEPVEKKGQRKGCEASFSTQAELRKHKKRHRKLFSCTFDRCYSKFGTKWEWKRHERAQHIQKDAWRCVYRHGATECQQLYEDRTKFEDHLRQNFGQASAGEIDNMMDECRLCQRWLGSYWCGHCRQIVRSKKPYGEEMVEERFDHVSQHVVEGMDSLGWVEQAANGKTKREMKEIDERGNLRTESIPNGARASELSSRDEHDDNASESGDSDDSHPPRDGQRQMAPSQPNALSTTHNSQPSSSPESQIGPAPVTPNIRLHAPDGQIIADSWFENVGGGTAQPRQMFMDTGDYQDPPSMQASSLFRWCCQCRSEAWPNQDRCDFPTCRHLYCSECWIGPSTTFD